MICNNKYVNILWIELPPMAVQYHITWLHLYVMWLVYCTAIGGRINLWSGCTIMLAQYCWCKKSEFIYTLIATLKKVFNYRKKGKPTVRYRVSHKTWQLVNSFECRLPYTVLHIKDFLHFTSLKNSFTQICFTLKSNLLFHECHIIFFIVLLGIKKLKKIWKKTLLSCFVGHPVYKTFE